MALLDERDWSRRYGVDVQPVARTRGDAGLTLTGYFGNGAEQLLGEPIIAARGS